MVAVWGVTGAAAGPPRSDSAPAAIPAVGVQLPEVRGPAILRHGDKAPVRGNKSDRTGNQPPAGFGPSAPRQAAQGVFPYTARPSSRVDGTSRVANGFPSLGLQELPHPRSSAALPGAESLSFFLPSVHSFPLLEAVTAEMSELVGTITEPRLDTRVGLNLAAPLETPHNVLELPATTVPLQGPTSSAIPPSPAGSMG